MEGGGGIGGGGGAGWELQGGVQLTWPHADTEWREMLDEVDSCFVGIAAQVSKRERLLVVTPEPERVSRLLAGKANLSNITFVSCMSNDTWARDHGAMTCESADGMHLLDFCFNGWGLKFAANHDNLITERLVQEGVLKGEYHNCRDFVFEGGSIESDGEGTLLTTAHCLMSGNRNAAMSREEIEEYLLMVFGSEQLLWLNHGYLAGDDTDSHVDTLARLCPNGTIAYVQCTDKEDEHYEALHKMEQELKMFRTLNGEPFRLVALPMAKKVEFEGERLPATYANYLVINGAVLMPTYGTELDEVAKQALALAYPEHEIVGIDCSALIKQHGSLHCVTMQYPEGVL